MNYTWHKLKSAKQLQDSYFIRNTSSDTYALVLKRRYCSSVFLTQKGEIQEILDDYIDHYINRQQDVEFSILESTEITNEASLDKESI